ncbi:MAG: hypothetical protein ABI237_10635 [Ginsengibacter sp.]
MKKNLLSLLFIFISITGFCQQEDSLIVFSMVGDVQITLDFPSCFSSSQKNKIILYALPNGSSTAQTMGKKIEPGDDWRFDIQHIRAQTHFIRNKMKGENVVVVYLENSFKSWPLWKSKHENYISMVQHIVDTLYNMFPSKRSTLCLNGHSGGGRFIFSYLDGLRNIPKYIDRIVFLDSDYGYENSYGIQIRKWLQADKHHRLQVFAYEDSLVEVNGKRIVSDTGGTWYRTHLMLKYLSAFYSFKFVERDSLLIYKSINYQIAFYLKPNPEKKIYHTTQVELNGFIHSILAGTRFESEGYQYFGKRFINEIIQMVFPVFFF